MQPREICTRFHATDFNKSLSLQGIKFESHEIFTRNGGEGGMPIFSSLSANPIAPTSLYPARKENHPPAPDTPARQTQEPAPVAIPCKPPRVPPPKPAPRSPATSTTDPPPSKSI